MKTSEPIPVLSPKLAARIQELDAALGLTAGNGIAEFAMRSLIKTCSVGRAGTCTTGMIPSFPMLITLYVLSGRCRRYSVALVPSGSRGLSRSKLARPHQTPPSQGEVFHVPSHAERPYRFRRISRPSAPKASRRARVGSGAATKLIELLPPLEASYTSSGVVVRSGVNRSESRTFAQV